MVFSKILPRIKRSFLKPGTKYGADNRKISSEVYNHGELKLLVIGNDHVGKTSICQSYVGHSSDAIEEESHIFDTGVFITIDNEPRQYDLELFVYEKDKQNFMDYKKTLLSADGYILVYSKYSKESFIRLFEIIADIRHLTSRHHQPIIIIGNNTPVKDLPQVTKNDVITAEYKHFEIDTNKNEGIHEAVTYLVRQSIETKDATKRNETQQRKSSLTDVNQFMYHPKLKPTRSKSLTPYRAENTAIKPRGKLSIQHY